MPSCGMNRHARRNIPQQEPLPGDNRPIPYFIIGDNAFALNDVDDEAVPCSNSGTGRAGLQLSSFSRQTMRRECLWHTGQSLGLPTYNPSTRAAECNDHGECVTLHNMLRTAGEDDAGCWNWHTQRSASVGTCISSHVLVAKGNRT